MPNQLLTRLELEVLAGIAARTGMQVTVEFFSERACPTCESAPTIIRVAIYPGREVSAKCSACSWPFYVDSAALCYRVPVTR
jgi:hypothetical protein